ncbi:MAG TPA: SMP-30/gluconolactonase/LRE family protein, partial [Opitutaceae bacterium]|nr:SMP-30/gluconolactonase/LRE family protein [Opitutaceae bacterium]
LVRPTMDLRADLFRSTASQLGEGILWHPTRLSLFWVDILGQKIFETRVDSQDQTVTSLGVEKMIGALVPHRDGSVMAILHDGVYAVDLTASSVQPHSIPGLFDTQALRFNDAKCDPWGRLWAGTLSLHGKSKQAALYSYSPRQGWHTQRTEVSISNGLAWSLDHRTLYYIDSSLKAVQAFDFEPETGSLSHPRTAFDVSSVPGLPDGCTLDSQGRLWIAHWGGSCVSCWDPIKGKPLGRVTLPVSQVTNCTFGGARLDTLFITTAACELDAAQRQCEPLAGQLFCADVKTTGLPAVAFE